MFDITYMYIQSIVFFKKNQIYIKSTVRGRKNKKENCNGSLALFLNSESKPLIITTLKWYDNPQPFNQKVCFS